MFYNWNVIGHEKELSALEKDILSSALHHAYLFVGPEKIGKFRIAKAMTAILQCQNNFCHTCPVCIQIEKKCHADTIELEDDGESIKIHTIRDIIARLAMTGQGKYKILLIENIGRLTQEASNCLLKILEEPPEKTLFIFTAGQLRDIIPTIASRMRFIYFKKLQDEVLKKALQDRYPQIDDETLDQVLLLSLGRSGRAIQLISQPEIFQELRELYRHIQFLQETASASTRILAANEISRDEQKLKLFLSLLAHYYRKKLLEEKSENRIHTIEAIHRALDLLGRNVNTRLILEHLMMQL